MKLSNKVYDALKWVAQYFLPALGTLYFTIASLLGWSDADIVVGVITAVDTFLGAILGISTMQYNKIQKVKEVQNGQDS